MRLQFNHSFIHSSCIFHKIDDLWLCSKSTCHGYSTRSHLKCYVISEYYSNLIYREPSSTLSVLNSLLLMMICSGKLLMPFRVVKEVCFVRVNLNFLLFFFRWKLQKCRLTTDFRRVCRVNIRNSINAIFIWNYNFWFFSFPRTTFAFRQRPINLHSIQHKM